FDPIPIFNSATQIATIDFSLNGDIIEKSFRTQLRSELITGFQDTGAGLFPARDRQNYDVRRRDARRQNNAVVVPVRHNDCAYHARRHSPARGPSKFLFALTRLELNSACAGEILP